MTSDASGAYSVSVPENVTPVTVLIVSGDYTGTARSSSFRSRSVHLDFELGRRQPTLCGLVTEVTPNGVVPEDGVRFDACVCEPDPFCSSYSCGSPRLTAMVPTPSQA